MHRRPHRLSVCTLLLASLLVACGGTEAIRTESEDLLGTTEAALCSGLSVSTFTISGASTYQGEMAASGSWAVSSGANAIRLEYYIDNTLYASEERPGTSGTWYFSQAGISCGTHTLLVKTWPMVIDSAGNRTTCWAATKSTSKSISEACPAPDCTANGICNSVCSSDPDCSEPTYCIGNAYCSASRDCGFDGMCKNGRCLCY